MKFTSWTTFCICAAIVVFAVSVGIGIHLNREPLLDIVALALYFSIFPAACALLPLLWRFLLARIAEVSVAVRKK